MQWDSCSLRWILNFRICSTQSLSCWFLFPFDFEKILFDPDKLHCPQFQLLFSLLWFLFVNLNSTIFWLGEANHGAPSQIQCVLVLHIFKCVPGFSGAPSTNKDRPRLLPCYDIPTTDGSVHRAHMRQLPLISALSTPPEQRQPCTGSMLPRLKCAPALTE